MSRAYAGFGSKMQYSLDQVNWSNVAQLQRFEPSASKQRMADQTSLRTPGNFTQPKAVQVDAGELEFAGVYSGDFSQFRLGEYHGAMTLVYFRVWLSDGTCYSFAAYVSEFKAWAAVYNKYIPFSGKLRVAGGIESPLSGFQGNGFDPNGFQVVLI